MRNTAVILLAAASITGCAYRGIDDTLDVNLVPEDLVLDTDDVGDVVPGQFIVVRKPGVGPFDFDHFRVGFVRELAPQNATVVAGVDDDTLRDLAADRDVLEVIPDAIARIVKGPPGGGGGSPPPQALPAGIDRIGADEIANKGAGAVVCIVDTGIDYRHADLAGRYIGGKDFVNNDNDPLDDEGHGTHVAGTIAATDDGQGVVGVAPQASLLSMKVLNRRGSGSYSAITAGINECTARGADVMNMSLGGPSSDSTQLAALQAAKNAGVTVVVAAGNDGVNLDTSPHYPAAYDGVVVTVAAAWIDDTTRAFGTAISYPSFTNTGSAVDLSAPGVYVVSDKLGGGTVSMSGTSMACPHVAGAAALYVSAHPGASYDEVLGALTSSTEDVNNINGFATGELLNVRGF